MDLPLTLGLLGLLAAAAGFCGWRGSRPPDPRKGPRLVPWPYLMVTCVAAAFFVVAHLLNLLGLATGSPGSPGSGGFAGSP